MLAAHSGALYGLLVYEDNTFPAGSLLVFALAAAALLLTRNVNWYSLRQATPDVRDDGGHGVPSIPSD